MLNLRLKVDREGASLMPCSSSFRTFAPRNENAFWPLLVFILGRSKSVSEFLKLTISLNRKFKRIVIIGCSANFLSPTRFSVLLIVYFCLKHKSLSQQKVDTTSYELGSNATKCHSQSVPIINVPKRVFSSFTNITLHHLKIFIIDIWLLWFNSDNNDDNNNNNFLSSFICIKNLHFTSANIA